MKQKISLLLLLVLIFSVSLPVFASSKYESAGQTLSELKILTGDDKGNLMLDKNLKRQDMVVLVSRLYSEEKTAKNYRGTNIFKDLNSNHKFYIPYIIWSKDKNLIKGMEIDEFGFDKQVTVQEFQTVLLRSLGYTKEASNWNEVPRYAQDLNIMNSVSAKPNSKLTRGEMAQMIVNSLDVKIKDKNITLSEKLAVKLPELFEIKVDIDKDTVNFKGLAKRSNKLSIFIRPTSSNIKTGAKSYDVKLDNDGKFDYTVKDLQAGNYEYRLEGDNARSVFNPFTIKEEAFELEKLKTNNLREISLEFNKPVDTEYASFTDNYSTDAGYVELITFSSDKKTIKLRLKNSMRPGEKYNISASKIKSESGDTISLKDETFKASGSDMPKVLTHTAFRNHITINFNKKIDQHTLKEYSNYYINFNDKIIYLPVDSKIDVNDKMTIYITLPEVISGETVLAGKNLKAIELRGIKDLDGNDTDPLIIRLPFDRSAAYDRPRAISYYDSMPGKQAILEDKDTIKIKFNIPILEADKKDFISRDIPIKEVITDGTNIITLKLDNKYGYTSIVRDSLRIDPSNKIETKLGEGVESDYIDVIDTVSPEVITPYDYLEYDDSTVYIEFSEELEYEGSRLYKRDIEVIEDGHILKESDYETYVDEKYPNILRVEIRDFNSKSEYEIDIKGKYNGSISYIKDKFGNLALPSGPYDVK